MTNVPYPPWWIERAAARRARLEHAVEQLRARLPEFPDVKGALVFGSYARNEVGPESDLDIFVVQESTDSILDRSVKVRRLLHSFLDVAFDLIVYTPEEYREFAEHIPFVAQAVHEGFWIDAHSSS